MEGTSRLGVVDVGPEHSGNYTCVPENAAPATVTVYVLRGKDKMMKGVLERGKGTGSNEGREEERGKRSEGRRKGQEEGRRAQRREGQGGTKRIRGDNCRSYYMS